MPQLNEQQLNQLKFAEDYAKNRQQEWNSFASKAMLYKWNIYGPENKENVLLLKSLLVLKDKNAITEEKLNEVLENPDPVNGHRGLFEFVTDLDFLARNEKDPDVIEAMKCVNVLKGFFDEVYHEKKMNEDPAYAANYLKEQEKKQKANKFTEIEKHLSSLDGKVIFNKNLPIANPDELMKLQFRNLNDAELDQCEAVYDELFKIPSTGEILPPERFVARKPMDTDPHYRYFPLCAPAPNDQNETEEAKKIRLKKGKAEVLRAILDPARQTEFRYDDWGDAYGAQGVVEVRQFLRTTNIKLNDSKQWEDAVLKKKAEFNKTSRDLLTNALANPDGEILLLEQYDAQNPDTNKFDLKKFSVADYGKCIKAASLFDKMFKGVSDKRAEIGFKDLEKEVNYNGASVYGKVNDALGHELTVRGWDASVITKAVIVYYLSKASDKLTFKPHEFSKFKPGFLPTLTNKAPYPMVLTGNIMDEANALKAQQEAERNRILQENADAEKAFDDEVTQKKVEAINRNQAQTDNLTNEFVDSLNNKQFGLGNQNRNVLFTNASLITKEKFKKLDSEEYRKSVSDNKYPHRNLNDLTYRSFFNTNKLLGNDLIENYGGNKENEVSKILSDAGLDTREFRGDVSSVAVFMYALGVKGMTLDQVLNLNDQQKFALSKEALDEFAKRPITGDGATSKETVESNLAWYGKMVNKANLKVYKDSGITFPDINRMDTDATAVDTIFRNEKFGFVYEYAKFSLRFMENWTNKSSKITPENRFGINSKKEFLKGYKDGFDPLSDFEYDKAVSHSIIGFGDAVLAYNTNDLQKNNNPNTHFNRIKMVKHDLLKEQYGELSGKSVYSDQNKLLSVGFTRRAICDADLDNETMDRLSQADEKNAERLLSMKANPDATIPNDLLKDNCILKLATKTAGLHKDLHGSKYIQKELEDAFALLNDADKPEILKFGFNKPENVGNELDFDNLKDQEDLLDEVSDTFDDIFSDYLSLEEQFFAQIGNNEYKNLVLLDRFQINGVSVKDLVAQKTNIKDSDFEELDERTRLGKAMILHAMADPNANLTFTPVAGEYYAKPIAVKNYTNELHLQRQQAIEGIQIDAVMAPEAEFRPFENIDEEIRALNVELPARMSDYQMQLILNEAKAYSIAMRFKPYPHSQELANLQKDVSATQPDPKVVNLGYTKQQIDNFFSNAGLNMDRESTHASDFTFYLMGVKGMSLEEAARMSREHPAYDRNIKEFIAFVKSHPVKQANEGDPELTPAKRRENIKAWTDLFLNAYDKFKEYRLPDIDYSDPKQIALHQRELTHIAKVGMDYFQEVGEFMKTPYAGEIRLAAGDFEKLQGARAAMSMLNPLATGLNFGFINDPVNMPPVAPAIRTAAVSRALLKDVSDDLKGKSIADLYKNANQVAPKLNMLLNAPALSAKVENEALNTDKAIEYLRGQNKDYENTILSGQQARINDWYNQINSVSADSANRFFAEKNNEPAYQAVRSQLYTIFMQNQDAHTLYNTFIANEDKTLLNGAMGVFQAFDKTNEERMLRDVYGISLLDAIRIDGRTPQELWGDKYNFIDNAAERQSMYAIEILKEYYTGKKPITIDTFSFNQNGEVYKSNCVQIGKDPLTIQRANGILNEVSKLHTELTAMKQKLTAADRRASAADRGRLRENEKYNEMMTALDECIAASDVTADNKTLDQLDGALLKFNQKASEYAKARDTLTIHERTHQNAAPRLAKKGAAAEVVRYKQANDAKNKIPETIAKIRNLAAPLGIMLNEHTRGKYVVEQGKFGKIRQFLDLNTTLRHFSNEEVNRPVDVNRTWNNENEYQWLVGTNMENLVNQMPTADQAKQLNDAGKFGIGLEPQNECLRQGTLLQGPNQENVKIFKNVGFRGTRQDTVHGIFLLWLMGQKGYDINTLAKTLDTSLGADGRPKNEQLMREIEKERAAFVRFCTENPVKNAAGLSDEQYEKNIENWANVFMAATEKMKSYTLPNIDYSDAAQAQNFIREFTVLKTLGINFGQEFPLFLSGDHANKPAKDIFEVKLNAVGGNQKLLDQWLKMQSFTDLLHNAYVGPDAIPVNQPLGYTLPILSQVAGYRHLAGEFINPFKGQSLGEAAEKTGNAAVLLEEIQHEFNAQFCPKTDGEIYDYKDSVGFVLGQNREAFRTKTKDYLKNAKAICFKKTGDYSVVASGKMTEIVFGDMRNRFNALDNSAEAMKNFLKENASENQTVRHWLNEVIQKKFFDNEQYRFMIKESGLKYSDCITIDGKTPNELWGAKYEGESATEKETLLLAEVVRAIAKGDSVIRTKQFSMTADGKIHQGGEILALEKNSKLNEIQNAAINSYITEKELLYELKEIQKALQATQGNKNANLTTNDIRTGSDLYQDLCLKLDKAIIMLDKSVSHGAGNDVNRHDVVSALNDFSKANETYFNSRKGILFGPRRDYGKKRLATTVRAYETLAAFSPRLGVYLNSFSSDMVEKTATMKEGDAFTIMTKAQNIRKFLGMQKMSEEDMVKGYVHNCIAQRSFEINSMNGPKIPESKANIPQEREKYELAFRYIKARTNDILNKHTATLDDVHKLDHLSERCAELANNPAFRSFMKVSEKNCIELFHKIEKKAEDNLAAYKTEADHFGNLPRFVIFGDKNKQHLNAQQKQQVADACVNSAKKIDYGKKDEAGNLLLPDKHRLVHARLAEVLLAQILADPTEGKCFRQWLAKDQLIKEKNPAYDDKAFYEHLKSNLCDIYANDKKALEASNVANTIKKLENGELKKEAAAALRDSLKPNAMHNDMQNDERQIQKDDEPVMGGKGL